MNAALKKVRITGVLTYWSCYQIAVGLKTDRTHKYGFSGMRDILEKVRVARTPADSQREQGP